MEPGVMEKPRSVEVGQRWGDTEDKEVSFTVEKRSAQHEGWNHFDGNMYWPDKCFVDGRLEFLGWAPGFGPEASGTPRGEAGRADEWKVGQRRRVCIVDMDNRWEEGVLEHFERTHPLYDFRLSGKLFGVKRSWPSELLPDVGAPKGGESGAEKRDTMCSMFVHAVGKNGKPERCAATRGCLLWVAPAPREEVVPAPVGFDVGKLISIVGTYDDTAENDAKLARLTLEHDIKHRVAPDTGPRFLASQQSFPTAFGGVFGRALGKCQRGCICETCIAAMRRRYPETSEVDCLEDA